MMLHQNFSKIKFSWRRISQSEIRNSAAAEKRGRAKIHSPQPPFFLPARAFSFGSAARSAASCQFLEILDKMSSSQTVKTHQNLTFGKLTDFFVGGAKRRPSILPRQILSARHAQARLAVGQDEVRLPCDFNSVSDLLCPIIV